MKILRHISGAVLVGALFAGGCAATADAPQDDETETTIDESELSAATLRGYWAGPGDTILSIEFTNEPASTLGGGLKGHRVHLVFDTKIRCITTPCPSTMEFGGVYTVKGKTLTIAAYDKPAREVLKVLGEYTVDLTKTTKKGKTTETLKLAKRAAKVEDRFTAVLTKQPKPKTTCERDGVSYEVGATYLDKCNTCTCGESGSFGCTKKGCAPGCYGTDGSYHAVGESFKIECNTCSCSEDGSVRCTMIACPACHDDLGRRYPAGSSLYVDCNRCQCTAEGTIGACTRMGCLSEGCWDLGKHYDVGAKIPSPDGCNTCTCTAGGGFACTEKACL